MLLRLLVLVAAVVSGAALKCYDYQSSSFINDQVEIPISANSADSSKFPGTQSGELDCDTNSADVASVRSDATVAQAATQACIKTCDSGETQCVNKEHNTLSGGCASSTAATGVIKNAPDSDGSATTYDEYTYACTGDLCNTDFAVSVPKNPDSTLSCYHYMTGGDFSTLTNEPGVVSERVTFPAAGANIPYCQATNTGSIDFGSTAAFAGDGFVCAEVCAVGTTECYNERELSTNKYRGGCLTNHQYCPPGAWNEDQVHTVCCATGSFCNQKLGSASSAKLAGVAVMIAAAAVVQLAKLD